MRFHLLHAAALAFVVTTVKAADLEALNDLGDPMGSAQYEFEESKADKPYTLQCGTAFKMLCCKVIGPDPDWPSTLPGVFKGSKCRLCKLIAAFKFKPIALR